MVKEQLNCHVDKLAPRRRDPPRSPDFSEWGLHRQQKFPREQLFSLVGQGRNTIGRSSLLPLRSKVVGKARSICTTLVVSSTKLPSLVRWDGRRNESARYTSLAAMRTRATGEILFGVRWLQRYRRRLCRHLLEYLLAHRTRSACCQSVHVSREELEDGITSLRVDALRVLNS